ncbi:MAG: hypothetical protein QOG77_2732 [Solirubrobacteraceae bacterium]|nr:hypothetical protein [Solirubrobacteraceae bacterium]
MLAALQCRLEIIRGVGHTRPLLAGFLMLQKAGVVDLDVVHRAPKPGSWTHMLTVTVNGDIRLGYDVQDGVFRPGDSPENERYIDSLELMFARGYVPGSYGRWEDKVRPLGLNFEVGVRHPLSVLVSHESVRTSTARLVKRALRRAPASNLATFERPPRGLNGGPILFLTRLWDPSDDHGPPEDTTRLNEGRVELTRAMRNAFGDRLVGGLQPTEYALRHYPGDIAPDSLTWKRSYLEMVRDADVCVTTEGLAQSTGWKFAEYVAASKPIVTEPLTYAVPGNLLEGRNYLTFRTPEECVARVHDYLTRPELALQSAVANYDYHRTWARPDALVRHTLAEALVARVAGPAAAALRASG